jgi:outer membrane protein OmpA-like peptidoglycan-associated protein
MADLNVQPRKKGSILPWLLLALGIIALIFLLARSCNKDKVPATPVVADSTTTTTTSTSTNNAAAAAASGDWNNVDFNAPAVHYEEISDRNVEVRGNDQYAIYGLGENILFDKGNATIRPDAEKNLRTIASSIGKRYNGGAVRVYGHTDSQGSSGANQDLSAQRAEAVRTWLEKNGSIAAGNLSVHPQGESNPTATNATAEGRQENRRVEIVARRP